MKNWNNDTGAMLANSEFDQAHGGNEETRMRMIKGMPLDRITASRACHFSLVVVHECSLLLNMIRRVTKAMAEPASDPNAAGKKPCKPYVKPNKLRSVICPMKGGKDAIIVTRIRIM
jgi:hypothetical protein